MPPPGLLGISRSHNGRNVIDSPEPKQDRPKSVLHALSNVGRSLVGLISSSNSRAVRNSLDSPAPTTAATTPELAPAGAEPAPGTFDVNKYFTAQCNQITKALGDNKLEGRQYLCGLYDTAKTLKESIEANKDDIKNGLPEALRTDFEKNISLIKAGFKGATNQCAISTAELDFLKTYIDILKLTLGGNNALLKESFVKLSAALDKATKKAGRVIQQAENAAEAAGNNLREAEDQVQTQEAEHRRLRDAFNALPVAQQTPEREREVEAAALLVTLAEQTLAERTTEYETAVRKLNELTHTADAAPAAPAGPNAAPADAIEAANIAAREAAAATDALVNDRTAANIDAATAAALTAKQTATAATAAAAVARAVGQMQAADDADTASAAALAEAVVAEAAVAIAKASLATEALTAATDALRAEATIETIAAVKAAATTAEQAAAEAATGADATRALGETDTADRATDAGTAAIAAATAARAAADAAEAALPPLTAAQILTSALETTQNIELTQTLNRLNNTRLDDYVDGAICQQFKDLADSATLVKIKREDDKKWLAHATHLAKEMNKLTDERGAMAVITLPDSFNENTAPTDIAASLKINGHSVYQHALLIIKNQSGVAGLTVNDRKLALAIAGGFSLLKTVTDRDKSTCTKAMALVNQSAKLLAASLIQKTAPANNLKQTLATHCTALGLNHLSDQLSRFPEDTEAATLTTHFNRGVSLEVAKNLTEKSASAASLLKEAKTNRTFKNDFTYRRSNKSRQEVFRDSMLRASEMLSKVPANTRENKITRATEFTLNPTADELQVLLGLRDGTFQSGSTELLDQLVLAASANNDLSTKVGHVARGSLYRQIKKFNKHTSLSTSIGHDLNSFSHLHNTLFDIAKKTRPMVDARINDVVTRLNANRPVSDLEIQRLLKQIIITTDAKAASDTSFNLNALAVRAAELARDNSTENRTALAKRLEDVQTAWTASRGDEEVSLDLWNSKDERSTLGRIVRSNPVKSMPLVNRVPVLSHITAAAFDLGKVIVAAGAGAALGAVGIGAAATAVGVVAGAVVAAAPVVAAGLAIQKSF